MGTTTLQADPMAEVVGDFSTQGLLTASPDMAESLAGCDGCEGWGDDSNGGDPE